MEECTSYDECKIEYFSTRRKLVRRPFGQRFNEKYTCKTVRHPFTILVWGLIKGDVGEMFTASQFSGIARHFERRTPGNIILKTNVHKHIPTNSVEL